MANCPPTPKPITAAASHGAAIGATATTSSPAVQAPTASAIQGRRSPVRSASAGRPRVAASWLRLNTASSSPARSALQPCARYSGDSQVRAA
jgi:hypothetical protein